MALVWYIANQAFQLHVLVSVGGAFGRMSSGRTAGGISEHGFAFESHG
jgi:hypothetical protein